MGRTCMLFVGGKAMAKKITVIVHTDGRLEANLAGYRGTECEKDALLQEIQAMLAPGSVIEKKHPEYYQRQGQQVQLIPARRKA